jgi:hypothetical protein
MTAMDRNRAGRRRRKGKLAKFAGAGETKLAAATRLARRRTPLHVSGFPLILLYSPKSGCTSAVKWFFWQTGLLEEAQAYGKWVHRFENQVFKRTSGYRMDLIAELCLGQKRLIKFTRNPFQRAVSSFLMLSGPQLGKLTFFGHAEWKKIRTYKYGAAEDKRGASFVDFLCYLRDADSAKRKINGHFAQQYRPDESAFNVEYYRLENMSATFRELEAQLGLAAAPDDLLSSHHHRRYMNEVQEDVSTLDIDEDTFVETPPPNYRAFYTAHTIDLVRQVFKDDFEHYGYSATL